MREDLPKSIAGKKAIIFDYDDTLVLTQEYSISCHQKAAKKLGLRIPSRKELLSYLGTPWNQCILGMWPGINIEDFKKAFFAFADPMPIRLAAGVKGSLPKLKKKGYSLFILTSKMSESILRETKKSHLDLKLFSGIYGPEQTQWTKPDPRVFEKLLKENKLKASECVNIGDSMNDYLSAKAAGIDFIGVLTGQMNHKEFTKKKIMCIWSMEELLG